MTHNTFKTKSVLSRRSFTRTAATLVTGASIAPFISGQAFASPLTLTALKAHRPAVLGHDLSIAQQLESVGKRFSDGGHIYPIEHIVAAHGATHVRLRLWVNPPAPFNDLPHVLSMAKRIKAAGLELLLDIHYSDFWADPGKQNTPASWQGQSLSTLTTTVYNYTHSVLTQLYKEESSRISIPPAAV